MFFAQTSAHAQSPADVSVARDLFKEGAKFAQDGEWNEARQRYEKSLALKRSPRTLYSLGIAYRNLRRFVESLESYRAFLVEMQKDDDKPYEQAARDAIAELEKEVAKLDIKVLVDDDDVKMTLTIDGIIVPEAAYGYPRLVDPGKHTVLVRAKGYADATQVVTVNEGDKQTVSLRLAPSAKTDLFHPIGPDKPDVAVLPTVLIAAGSATFAVGLTVGLVGVQRAKDAPTRDGDDADSARRSALAGDIIGGIGIVSAGAGLTLLLVDKFGKPRHRATKPSTGWVMPVVTPGGVGVVGHF
jgi:hypothetical protein